MTDCTNDRGSMSAAAPAAGTDPVVNTLKDSLLRLVGRAAVIALGLGLGALVGAVIALFAGLIEFTC